MGWNNPPVPWRELRRRMAWRFEGEFPDQPNYPDPPRLLKPAPPPATAVVPWAELHCHSSYSFLDGAATPGELVTEAARLGLETLAITDHDGMYGVPQFAQAAARLRDRGGKLERRPRAQHEENEQVSQPDLSQNVDERELSGAAAVGR